MSDLVEWLTKILDEDSDPSEIPHVSACNSVMGGEAGWGLRKCDCEIPARWLADIAAKRAILEQREQTTADIGEANADPRRQMNLPILVNIALALDTTIQHLASAYATRPGYDESWRP